MKLLRPLLWIPRWVLTAVCAALICYLTLVPQPLPDNDIQFWEHTDKVVHAIMFGALYVCLMLDIWRGARPSAGRAWLLAGAVTLAGAAIEVAQQLMDMGRGGSWGDLAADFCGIVLALALMRKIII